MIKDKAGIIEIQARIALENVKLAKYCNKPAKRCTHYVGKQQTKA